MSVSKKTQDLPAEFTLPNRYPTNRSGPERWLFSHFLRYWPIGILLLLGAFGNAALAAYVPIKIGEAFDAILNDPPKTNLLLGFFWAVVISQLIRGGLQFVRNFGAEWLGQLFERNVRDELYVSLLGKSMTFHNLQLVGETMARATNDVREINFMLNPGINLVIGSGNFLILPMLVSWRYHPSLVIIPAIFVLVYIISIKQYLGELQPITKAVRDSFGTMNTRLAEAIDGIETVKSMSEEENEVKRFQINAGVFRNAFVRQADVEARFLPLLFMGITQAAGLLHSLILFKQGLIQVGDVVAYFGLLQLFGFPTFVSLFAYSQVSLGMASTRRILELINEESDLDQNESGFAEDIKGSVEFKNISFAYDKNENVLNKINFSVEPGQTVAIVGQTGGGKTSLVKLVNRIYDVSAGQVLVDGIDVRDWQLESLRHQVSIIEQDIFLFSRSIAENICFGQPTATREEIIEAAKAAQADEFILEFKDGYDTVIGERGVTLSGGQRQRLALARAFLTDPRILVLDDSTSAIDSATEDKIQRAIYAAAKGRTTLIITHRLSQIRWADLIVVLRQGKVAAVGTHEELLKTSEAYRQIFSE
ncbi:MAG: ABC transporter ATP-binding protein [Chloroflexi bacterium]|jgi:ATP-binding cassette, subfamily B, bacterial|nr:ABC transporter ATP-binding protein [Chloroflexota bacterium]MBT3671143.1 ABC transporter ATP-binding protein [Chloroflexota bacterium]MBT4304398.1 ABC transporter ATP-binding protein [Chloroflexota bacterium]MBT4534417.1 ABC transporter ATP-binding protein [Chloroflexota bacterium]MBT4682600.1 ABC transporter ATP-binding protein [Chloroflexota bacterium]